jgi:hypothetical protein
MPAKTIAAMELGVPAAPTGAHKPTDVTAHSFLRDSAPSKTGRPLSSNNPHIIDFVDYYVYVGGALAAKACTAQLRG